MIIQMNERERENFFYCEFVCGDTQYYCMVWWYNMKSCLWREKKHCRYRKRQPSEVEQAAAIAIAK